MGTETDSFVERLANGAREKTKKAKVVCSLFKQKILRVSTRRVSLHCALI